MIHFTDHAMNRWWERCEANNLYGRQAAMNHLRERLAEARWVHWTPSWCRLTQWHRARAEGSLLLSDDCCFIVNRNASGDLVAVTYLEEIKAVAA